MPQRRRPVAERVAFVSTRIAGTDGVSLEIAKWAEVIEHNYEVGRQFFSYEVVQQELELMIQRPQNIYRLLGRRRARSR